MTMKLLLLSVLIGGLTACSALPSQQAPTAPAATDSEAEPLADAVAEAAAAAEAEDEVERRAVLYLGTDKVVEMPEKRPPVRVDGKAVSLDFEEAPITEVVHAILGDILELDYVIEHPLEGTLTLHTRTPVARDELLPVLESLLQANGIALVRDPNGRFFVSASGKLRTLLPAFGPPDASGAGYRHVIVPLSYISAAGMADILGPVAPEGAFVRVDAARNLLVLAGTRNQVEGWLEIIRTFDIDQLQGMSVGIFPIENAAVAEVGAALGHLLGGDETPGSDLTKLIRIMPLERLSSILVVSPRSHYIGQVQEWIDRLDRDENAAGEPTLHVYEVQNGAAEHLAQLLQNIFGNGGGGSLGGGRRPDSGVAPGLDEMSTGSTDAGGAGGAGRRNTGGGGTASFNLGDNVRVVADDYNNALLVYAPATEYRKIESALRRLDVVAKQVLIEASIIEVNLVDDLEYGVEWFLENSLSDGRTGSAFLNLGTGSSIGPRVPGFSYSIADSAGVIEGVVNALAERSMINVISTPSVMVLDNHTASIQVGDQQPIQSAITITDGGNTQSSIEYRDTGVQLEVTPSVNAGGLVTMDILQSVTDVGPVDTATNQRSFLERNVSSRVAVRNGESVVLGGLIRDNQSTGNSGLPVLSQLPVLGALFGRTTNSSNRTELLVFITPRVLRNQQDLRDISGEMRARMKGITRFNDLPGIRLEATTEE